MANVGLPWTWFNRAKQDIFWVSNLTTEDSGSGPIDVVVASSEPTSASGDHNWQQMLKSTHTRTGTGATDDRPVCTYYSRPGGCRDGKKCKFKHVDQDREPLLP